MNDDQDYIVDMYHKSSQDKTAPSTRRIKIEGHSVYEQSRRSLEFHKELLRGKGQKIMAREEMLNRLILVRDRKGHISEQVIKQDPVLILRDVVKEFGSVANANKAVKAEIYRRKHKMKVDEFKDSIIEQQTKAEKEATKVEVQKQEGKGMVDKGTKKGRHSVLTEELVHQKVLDYAIELGRIPKDIEIFSRKKEDPTFPSHESIRKKLGVGWRKKLEAELNKKPDEIREEQPKQVEKQPRQPSTTSSLEKVEKYIETIQAASECSSSIEASAEFEISSTNNTKIRIIVEVTKSK